LLPDIDFNTENFIEEKDGKRIWTNEAKKFAARMTSAAADLDKAIHSSNEVTPPPSWTEDSKFALPKELDLRPQLLESERAVERAQKHKRENTRKVAGRGAVASCVGIWCGALSGISRVPDQAARSMI
jgi:hypothetical protein